MISVHNRAKHSNKDEAKVKIEDEVKSKRIESKAAKFCENESRQEFRRKKAEFRGAALRCRFRFCKGNSLQCCKCKLYEHMDQCCTP